LSIIAHVSAQVVAGFHTVTAGVTGATVRSASCVPNTAIILLRMRFAFMAWLLGAALAHSLPVAILTHTNLCKAEIRFLHLRIDEKASALAMPHHLAFLDHVPVVRYRQRLIHVLLNQKHAYVLVV
jgi:hypothetical protein